MPRDIPVGNGKLLVCFDREYCLRELFFPYVGQENHIQGKVCRLGVWAEEKFSWVGPDWRKELRYLPETMVTEVKLHHPEMEVSLIFRDAVDFHEDVYLKQVTVDNLASRPREVRLFFHLDLGIAGNDLGDTAGFDPKTGAVIHYKGPRYFLISGLGPDGDGLSQYAVGQKGISDKEGTFRDAEDGLLSGNLIAQGSVDSVVCVSFTLEAKSLATAFFWIAAGFSWYDVQRLDSLVKYKHPQKLIKRTEDYWRLWIRKESPPLELLPEKLGRALPSQPLDYQDSNRRSRRDSGGQRLGHHLFQSGYLLLYLASGRGLSCLCLGFGRAPHGLEEFLPLHFQTPPA